jgi:O-antigen/teichoic acid export membrane protein
MSDARSTLHRLASSAGLYAVAGLAQQALGFLFVPIYTRIIAPDAFGSLELLNAFSSLAFAFETGGLASAIKKCYHRD